MSFLCVRSIFIIGKITCQKFQLYFSKKIKDVSIGIAKFLCIHLLVISIVIGLHVKLRNARSFCLVYPLVELSESS